MSGTTTERAPKRLNLHWTARTQNSKTGDVVTAWVGATEREAWDSCEGCPLREPRDGSKQSPCYAHGGTVAMGARSVYRAHARGKDYSLDAALRGRSVSARMVRVSAIGDAGRMVVEQAREIQRTVKRAGLALVGYTHHWRERAVREAWRGRLMASCESERDAERAVREAWRATMLVSGDDTRRAWRTQWDGVKVVTCPNQTHGTQCNDCLLCDASRTHLAPIIAFRVHGNQVPTLESMLERADRVASDLVALASQ